MVFVDCASVRQWEKKEKKVTCRPVKFSLDPSIYLSVFGCAGSSLLCGLFSSYSQWGLLFVTVRRLLISMTSQSLGRADFSSCGSWAWLLCSIPSRTRDQTMSLLGRWILTLSHQGSPGGNFFKLIFIGIYLLCNVVFLPAILIPP